MYDNACWSGASELVIAKSALKRAPRLTATTNATEIKIEVGGRLVAHPPGVLPAAI